MREARVNIAIRWFADYAVHEKLLIIRACRAFARRWGEDRFHKIFKRTSRLT